MPDDSSYETKHGLDRNIEINKKIAQRDLYGVLELPPGASTSDVKAAYRELAKKWHPDKNPDDVQVRDDMDSDGGGVAAAAGAAGGDGGMGAWKGADEELSHEAFYIHRARYHY